MHHASFRDADFQRSFRAEPLDFCVRCHAPRATGRDDQAGLDEGVGCASCHDGTVAHAAHPARERPTTRACDGCHEFSFPGRPERMQRTVAEHAGSRFALASCASCHMPATATHARSHGFGITRDPERLRASIAMDPVRRIPGGLEVRLRSVGVGHALPTGDLFRALQVRLWTEDRSGNVLSDDEAWLARTFAGDPGTASPAGRTEVRDDRIVEESRSVPFVVEQAAKVTRAHVVVRYDRVATVHGDAREVFDSTVLLDVEQDMAP